MMIMMAIIIINMIILMITIDTMITIIMNSNPSVPDTPPQHT